MKTCCLVKPIFGDNRFFMKTYIFWWKLVFGKKKCFFGKNVFFGENMFLLLLKMCFSVKTCFLVQISAICGADLDVCLIGWSKLSIYTCPIGLVFKSTLNKGLIGPMLIWTYPNLTSLLMKTFFLVKIYFLGENMFLVKTCFFVNAFSDVGNVCN